jgi:FlaA1/EpsC-like NDP-sugar epimerase
MFNGLDSTTETVKQRGFALKTQILVTGGAGYIGSTVCSALEERGFEPIAESFTTAILRTSKF